MKRTYLVLFVLLLGVGMAFGAGGTKKKKPLPYDYGTIVLNNFSEQAGMPPAVFDHWVHRQRFTCRVCHVDIGFGMVAGSTKLKAADNMKGYFCGTCHNGRTVFGQKKLFASCAKEYTREEYKVCVNCHRLERNAAREEIFYGFAQGMPKETFGNGINWEKAEELGKIKLVDYLEGVSVKKGKLKIQQDFSLNAKVEGMPDIIFSHKKHTVWSGCELCHPEIFVGVKKGSTKYSMVDIFDGKYCGVCHGKVAFPTTDCQRCHSTPVQ